jgi:hypothetical protein
VSDTKPAQPAQQKPFRLSMTKPGGPAPATPHIKPPRTIDYACIAMMGIALAQWLRALLLLGHTSTLRAVVIDANRHAKNPVKNFDALKHVHDLRVTAFSQAALTTLVLLLLIWALRRPRSASPSRWVMLVVFYFLGLLLSAFSSAGLPIGAQVASVIVSVLTVATIILIFVPPTSAKYFKQCREATMPPERRGQARPGLGSLFKPPPPRTAPAASGPKAEPPQRPATPKAKAKVRADDAAVAKGADLARSRAKASKSRRTAG